MSLATIAPGAKLDQLTGVPEGHDALVLGRMALAAAARGGEAPLLVHVARDDRRLEALASAIAFFTPAVKTMAFPAWDTVPYDRIGPNAEIVARRIAWPSRRRGKIRPSC
jgi:transcription-repair coupling factor (superfamily II helicase)